MNDENDALGNRMKSYEQEEAGRKAMPMLPVCVRLDGKTFSNFTRKLNRPFDERFSNTMIEVTNYLVDNTTAKIGYTQSDEISLIYYAETEKSEIFFKGKYQKMVSVLSSMATAIFNRKIKEVIPSDIIPEFGFFDCRAWSVPNKVEASNSLLWREFDASKNSISMAARTMFSHKEIMNKTGKEMQEMMFSKYGINWNDYPSFFKRGTFISRRKRFRTLTNEELMLIPEKYRPTQPVERTEIVKLDMPPFSKVVNRVEVIFDGADPLTAEKRKD